MKDLFSDEFVMGFILGGLVIGTLFATITIYPWL